MREGTTVGKIAACGATDGETVCSVVSGDSLEGQLVNSRGLKKRFIYAPYLLSSQQRKPILCAHSTGPPRTNGCIAATLYAATKLVWTAMFLNGSEASGPLTNGRTFS